MRKGTRAVITGVGVVSPLGIGSEPFWSNMSSGRSGVRSISLFPTDEFTINYAGQVSDFDPQAGVGRPVPKTYDRSLQMAYVASSQALRQSGLADAEDTLQVDYPVATIVGTGHGPCHETERSMDAYYSQGIRGVNPMTIPRSMYNSISCNLSIHFGLRGPNHVVVSACASATCAIGEAYRLISTGIERAVLCGGSDAPLCKTVFSAWTRMRILARRSCPQAACRPFDADRNGLVLGEGAGMLVLEAEGDAVARGAEILAVVEGFGASSDAFHITAPSKPGLLLAMNRSLADAGVSPDEIDYVNAHGTGTELNDKTEAESIMELFGRRSEPLPVSSVKSSLGHSLGASGALETIATVHAIQHQFVPPTLNCDHPSPEIGLDYVPCQGHHRPVQRAMSNSFAFGGNNAVLIIRGYD